MPINLFNNPLSSIKLGADDILKGYIGNGQIFPNDTEITAAAFTDTYIANTGGNTPYVVSGDIGSSFTLTGSAGATAPSGTQVIAVSPTTYQIAIGDQSTTCSALQRNSQVVITPQGNTILDSGLSNTDTIIQAAGPVTQTSNIGLTISVSNTGYDVQNVGGVLKWVGNTGSNTGGAEWLVTVNYTVGTMAPTGGNPPYIDSNRGFYINAASSSGNVFKAERIITPAYPSPGIVGANNVNSVYTPTAGSGSYSVRFRMNGGTANSVSFSVQTIPYGPYPFDQYGCWATSPSTQNSGNLFP